VKNVRTLFEHLRPAPPAPAHSDDRVDFRCNICGSNASARQARLTREEQTCGTCGSTVRLRSIVRVLSLELLGRALALPDFPVRKDIRGVGMSDWEAYASGLARAFDYTNTYYETEPRLDITNPADLARFGPAHFLTSSDVFEHVAPPVSPAFANLHSLLKPGGLLVFSVPFVIEETETLEHFPDLYEYELVHAGNSVKLVNTTREGHVTEYHDLVFHGGRGLTLEMRVFSRDSLIRELATAGFDQVRFYPEADPQFGVFWPQAWSLVLSARAF
jgi:hypothetical protein